MIVPNAEFRPNPARAVYVQGIIGQELIQRLTPHILLLQSQSRDPITVYIDSPGGSVYYMLALLRLLKSPTQDYELPCKLITVVTGQAASAAADLLSSGDYSLAYPGTSVLDHGGRLAEERPITAERSSFLAQMLRMTNENSAMELAREIEFRFMFRFITSRRRFPSMRKDSEGKEMGDLDCFLALISENVSDPARGILQTARERYARYGTLVETVLEKTKDIPTSEASLIVEAAQIKAIIEFEVDNNKDNQYWSFQEGGIHRLTDDFLLFQEYQAIASSDRFRRWCSQYGKFLLSADDLKEIESTSDEEVKAEQFTEKAGPVLQSIWSYFVALCHTLQRGEVLQPVAAKYQPLIAPLPLAANQWRA